MAKEYHKKGAVTGAVGALVALVVGVAVVTLILIFTGSLGGQTYSLVEPQIDAITNGTVKDHVKNSIMNGFDTMETTSEYLPIVVLAVIISIVLVLVLSFTDLSGGSRMGGSAL